MTVPNVAPSAKYRSPDSYTPKYLAEKIRTSVSLEDERKQVTVLFADIKGSLELIADRDPEDASHILDAVLRRMIEAIHHFEGTVNRVMGDGIMALFGAPAALENHAVRACYAALRMQENVKQFSEETRREGGPSIQVRIGINTGEVIVRSIQSDLQMDYAAVGETTHLAARMEQIATPGSILITSDVVNLTAGYIEIKPIGRIPVKGLRIPVPVFELIGVGATRSRLQAAAARGLTQFVGRAVEMKILASLLKSVEGGNGQVVEVSGEAGVGKSRLLYEFLHSNHARGWLIWESVSTSHGRGVPYFLMSDFLRTYFSIFPRDDARAIREKVTQKIFAFDQPFHEVIAPLLNVLEVLPTEHAFHELESTQRREQTAQAITRLVVAESRVKPVAVVFEDLQSCDSASLDVLEHLVGALGENRILLLLSSRSEYQHDWGTRPYYHTLRLSPLSRDSVAEMLHNLLGSHLSLEDLKERLIERTEGNPFFLEEILRMLVESQTLGGEPGQLYLTGSISGLRVPPLVQDVIASRIDRLPPEEIHVIREAAVIGKDFSFKLLHMMTDLPEAVLRGYLAHLQTAEFLYETQLFPDLEYTFKHALTHQVAYAGLLHETRHKIHARVMKCIETLHSDRLGEHIERLAHHAHQGEVWPQAVIYLRQAGAKTLDRSANREAVVLFGKALEALKRLPEDHDVLEQAVDVRFDIRNALQPLGDLGQILKYLREAESLAVRIGDQRRLGWVAAYLTEYFRMVGATESAAEAAERALAIALQLGDLPLQIVTKLPQGLLYHATGQYCRGIEVFQWIVGNLKSDHNNERFGLFGLPSVHSRTFLAWCFAEIGEFDAGLMIGEEAMLFAKRANRPSSLIYAYLGLGVVHLRRGDFQTAVLELERALEVGEFADIPVGFSYGESYLGYALILAGRTAEGLRLLEQSASSRMSAVFVARHSLRVAYLGEGYLLTGSIDAATAAAKQALELARGHKERGHEAYALRLLGDVMSRHNEQAESETYYRNALRIGQELGMRPLVAHCHWGLARLSRQVSDRMAEQRYAAAARAQFRKMEMVGWLQRMDAEFAEPDHTALPFQGNLH